jgi:hypothetical protein
MCAGGPPMAWSRWNRPGQPRGGRSAPRRGPFPAQARHFRARGRPLTSVFSDTRAERGEHVGLRLDPRGCHLFSAAPAGAAGPASASRQPSPAPATS